MKRSVCFQLRNRSLLKFKSSYVIAETAAQQPPKQAAVPCAAVPEMSWLCASACPSTGEEHEGAQQAQAVFQGVPVDRFKLHSKALPESWCTVHVACLSFKVGRTGTFDRSTDFRTLFKHKYKTLRPLHLCLQGIWDEVSAISPQLLAQGLCLAGVSHGMNWHQQASVATHSPSHGSSKSSASVHRVKQRDVLQLIDPHHSSFTHWCLPLRGTCAATAPARQSVQDLWHMLAAPCNFTQFDALGVTSDLCHERNHG